MKKSRLLFMLALALIITAWGGVQTGRKMVPPGQGTENICNAVSEIPVSECEALVALYNSTDGPNWLLKRDWLKTEQPCHWAGVKCVEGGVTAIALNYNDLRGNLPPEIGHLSRLRTLSLYFNYLSGPLPPELGKLSNLERLLLFNNKLSGPLPPELGKLSQLKELDLEANHLSGPIPAELGQLSSLETLNLNDNELSGQIPAELGRLSKLRGLFLAGNNLSGSVPPELGNLPELWMLNVSQNNLTGDLPPALQDLPKTGQDFLGVWAKGTPQSTPTATPTPTPTPAATERPLMQPYPYTTPLPAPTPTILDGLYVRDMVTITSTPTPCRRCPAYKLEGGEWTLSLDKGVFRVAHPITGFRSVASFTVSGDKLLLFNDPNCHLVVGTYTWSLAGAALTLKVVDDQCGFGLRAKNLTALTWTKDAGVSGVDQDIGPCQPPSLEAAISGHWPAPPGCQ